MGVTLVTLQTNVRPLEVEVGARVARMRSQRQGHGMTHCAEAECGVVSWKGERLSEGMQRQVWNGVSGKQPDSVGSLISVRARYGHQDGS